MKFFNNFFSTIYSRAYIKFNNNIFFLKNMLSLQLNHTLIPHLFIPMKTLKIKFINNVKFNVLYFIIYSVIFFIIFLNILYLIV